MEFTQFIVRENVEAWRVGAGMVSGFIVMSHDRQWFGSGFTPLLSNVLVGRYLRPPTY